MGATFILNMKWQESGRYLTQTSNKVELRINCVRIKRAWPVMYMFVAAEKINITSKTY